MSSNRIHRLDVFYSEPKTASSSPSVSTTEAIIVLAQTTPIDDPSAKPKWGIHFIGTHEDYARTYWNTLTDIIEGPACHPVARNIAELRKVLMASQRRQRTLIALEFRERGITTCNWSLPETENVDLAAPSPIKTNRKRSVLELQIDTDQATQALIDHSLRVKSMHRQRLPANNPYAQRELLALGMPWPAMY